MCQVTKEFKSIEGKNKKQKKGRRVFDILRYPTRHIALKVAYVGIAYNGLAYQLHTDNTIEVI